MRPSWDDDIAILSGENVSFAIETAGIGSRFAATVLDLLLQLVLITVTFIGYDFFQNALRNGGDIGQAVLQFATAGLWLLVFVIVWGYYFLFEWLANGQTPGKRAFGLRVVDVSGLPVTMWGSFLRNTIRTVDFLPIFYGLGALVAIINPHNRRLGDLGAGTVVARERREAGARTMSVDQAADAFLEALRAPVDATAGRGVAMAANVSAASVPRLTTEEWEVLAGFLSRRGAMGAVARERMAKRLVMQLGPKLGSVPYRGSEEAWLEEVARAASER